jgi:hypothetical protein
MKLTDKETIRFNLPPDALVISAEVDWNTSERRQEYVIKYVCAEDIKIVGKCTYSDGSEEFLS